LKPDAKEISGVEGDRELSLALDRTKDSELLTHHLIYLMRNNESEGTIKDKFSEFVRQYYEIRKSNVKDAKLQAKLSNTGLIAADKEVMDFLHQSYQVPDEVVALDDTFAKYLMLYEYTKRFGNIDEQIEICEKACDSFSDPIFVINYFETCISSEFLKQVAEAKDPKQIAKYEAHSKKAFDLFNAPPMPKTETLLYARTELMWGDYYFLRANKSSDFSKALKYYRNADSIFEALKSYTNGTQFQANYWSKITNDRIDKSEKCADAVTSLEENLKEGFTVQNFQRSRHFKVPNLKMPAEMYKRITEENILPIKAAYNVLKEQLPEQHCLFDKYRQELPEWANPYIKEASEVLGMAYSHIKSVNFAYAENQGKAEVDRMRADVDVAEKLLTMIDELHSLSELTKN
jgi:hypothetical protein